MASLEMRAVRGSARTIRCCRCFLVASFQQHILKTDGPSLSGAKIAWRYPGGAGFQWKTCDLSRRRFNVWEGLDLLDEKNPAIT